jgi:hypothetical protein
MRLEGKLLVAIGDRTSSTVQLHLENRYIYCNYLRRHIYGLINNINDELLNFLHNMDNHIEDIFVLIKDD